MTFRGSTERCSNDLVLSIWWAGRARTLRLNSLTGLVLLGLVPIAAALFVCATIYAGFHDRLLESLLTRQSEMQYSYEDRIVALKTQLDRETSRGIVDRHMLETTVRDLGERGAKLEARAATIDALVADGLGGVRGRRPTGRPAEPLLDPRAATAAEATATGLPGLRLDGLLGAGSGEKTAPRPDDHADLSDEALSALSVQLANVEETQTRVVVRLKEPAMRAVERMRTALAETGLPIGRKVAAADIGGPFVPLDATTSDFGQSVDLLRDVAAEFTRLSDVVDRVPLRKPLDGPLEVSSTFGARLDPFYGRPAMHTGIDLRESYGDSVEATAAGVVTIAGSEGGYGNMVEIDHGNGLTTRYAHLSSIEVSAHQRVAAGDIVGRVGSSGRATGPHLHYETRINGEAVDPSRFLKAGSALFPG